MTVLTEPVFVIHGVANRDQAGFEADVVMLADALGGSFDLKPVYWGDLGADDRWVQRTIPNRSGAVSLEVKEELRDSPSSTEASGNLALSLLTGEDNGTPDPLAVFTSAALGELGGSPDEELREDIPMGAEAAREAIAEQWPETVWLRRIDDPVLLREIGLAVGPQLADEPIDASFPELRDFDATGSVGQRIAELDRLVGSVFNAVGGRVNKLIRSKYAPGAARFLGDVLVYQRHQERIQDRIRSVIAEVDPVLGTDRTHPVRIVAHSLGGVIAVDLATAAEPLWTRSLVTFGSQSPFFHVCDPRGGQLDPFIDAGPVTLPESMGSWTNLWEPMDVLAFVAAPVFRLHDGSAPVDLPIPHLASSGMWTHSAYWRLRSVAEAIHTALVS